MLSSVLAKNGNITTTEILICTGVALVLGIAISIVYMYKNNYSKSFVFTLALLPMIVQSVIMVVNGNLGTGVAVAGAFSLVRFRSAHGTAKEILAIFFTMAVGLSCGMGYLAYATLFTLIVCIAMLVLNTVSFGEANLKDRNLRITIPENLDYSHLFDDLFEQYTAHSILQKVRTTNMGGLYELQYFIKLKNIEYEKELLDGIRQRNGNLTISCGMPTTSTEEL
ncbi:MAG: DUF4956 domain-containing protein [Clostridiaceae bacterium]|nr:DUF4956 domain-containing protein [Clostridiaceae bacterium]